MPRKDHLPRQTRQEHITLQPNRSIEFRVTDDFGSFSPPHWHDALSVHGKPLDSDADSGCVPCELSA